MVCSSATISVVCSKKELSIPPSGVSVFCHHSGCLFLRKSLEELGKSQLCTHKGASSFPHLSNTNEMMGIERPSSYF